MEPILALSNDPFCRTSWKDAQWAKVLLSEKGSCEKPGAPVANAKLGRTGETGHIWSWERVSRGRQLRRQFCCTSHICYGASHFLNPRFPRSQAAHRNVLSPPDHYVPWHITLVSLLFRCPSQFNLCLRLPVLLDNADDKNLDQLFLSLQNQNYPFAVSSARKDGGKDSVIISLQLDISS
jgi:hypothetical protein